LTTTYTIPVLDPQTKCCVTIGSFDGLHKGHQTILKQLVEEATKKGLKSLVFTFDPHPRTVLSEGAKLQLLTSLEEKKKVLEELGIDYLVVYPFDLEFSRLTAREFVENILVKGLHTKQIIIGYDHRFGRNRNADIDDLIEFGKEFEFEVQQIQAKQIDEISISSTKIRTALKKGDITTANTYLGYHYQLKGEVVHGNQLGRTIGYPTANIQIDEPNKLIPYQGVYIATAIIDSTKVYGMMNIGTKPTVDGTKQTVEIHFFDLDKDLYQSNISIALLHRLRDEQKFETIKHLEEQLQKDKAQSLSWIKQKKA
jgi:riboflavin kinase/FMN adenylyltransferase